MYQATPVLIFQAGESKQSAPRLYEAFTGGHQAAFFNPCGLLLPHRG